MNKPAAACLFLVGIINVLPVAGVLSSAQLESAYGVELDSSSLVILMRHRALLFGILGAFVLFSVFKRVYQKPAMLMAGASMLGFVYFAHTVEGFNANIGRVLLIDYAGLALLLLAAFFTRYHER